MGTHRKFDHEKSYVHIALQAFEDVFEELRTLKQNDGKAPSVEIVVKGSRESKFVVPGENFDEIIEILRVSLQVD
jgi:hypothetical protein